MGLLTLTAIDGIDYLYVRHNYFGLFLMAANTMAL